MCGSCERRWLNSKVRCDRCQRYRRPALAESNAGLCETCAGINSTQVCGRCDAEEDLYASARCAACYLADEIDRFRATGNPAAIRTLDRYLAALQTARPANSVLHWLRISRTSAAPILRDMLAGARPITHDAFDQAPAGHATEFLRAALVKHGALPERDELCHRFERWIIAGTEQLPDHPDRADLRRWATWIVLRDLRGRRRASLTADDRAARACVRVARDLIAWLHEQHITLETTSQYDVDRWLSEGLIKRRQIKGFLRWTSQTKLTVPLHAAGHLDQRQGTELADDDRLGLIARLVHDDDLELRTRVAGFLILLYGQPLARITRLRIEHIARHNGHTSITLGRDKLTLPAPIDQLVGKLADAPEGSNPPRPQRWRLAVPWTDGRRPDHTRAVATRPHPATRSAPDPTRTSQRHHRTAPNDPCACPRGSPRLQPKPRPWLGTTRRTRVRQLRRGAANRSATALKHLSPLGGTGALRAARTKTNTTNGNITPLPVADRGRRR